MGFFAWEIGYMRSIDIIVDRAGFYETWGCLVWVPSLYTLHTRVLVRAPSHLSLEGSVALFVLSLVGVFLNFWADKQREWFREANGEMNIFGRRSVSRSTVKTTRSMLLSCATTSFLGSTDIRRVVGGGIVHGVRAILHVPVCNSCP